MSDKRYEHVWLIYVQVGNKWVCLRNSKVFTSKKNALASMKKEELCQKYYQPLRIPVPVVDLVIQ